MSFGISKATGAAWNDISFGWAFRLSGAFNVGSKGQFPKLTEELLGPAAPARPGLVLEERGRGRSEGGRPPAADSQDTRPRSPAFPTSFSR